MGKFQTEQAEKPRQDQQKRNENGAALQHGNEDGPSFFAGALKQHAAERRGGERDQADAGIAQCLRADPDDVSVFPEEHDDLFRVEQAKDAYGGEQACGQREGEQESVPYAPVFLCPVVKGAYRLKTLPKAECSAEKEPGYAVDDAEGGNCGVSVNSSLHIQQCGCNAVHPLADHAREAAQDDIPDISSTSCKAAERDLRRCYSAQKRTQKDKHPDILRDRGGKPGPGGSEVEDEDQQRIQTHVEDAAGGKAYHGIKSQPFVAENVVEHAGCQHGGRCKQDIDGIGFGFGKYGLRAAEKQHKRFEKEQPQTANQRADSNGEEKAGADKSACPFNMPCTEQAADIAAGTVPEHKTECLEKCHQGEDDACSGAGGDGDFTDKVGVGRVVNGGDHHADHGRDRELDDQLPDGRLRHLAVFLFFSVHSFMVRLIRPFFSSTPSTLTLTISPTFSTSLGWRIYRSQIWEMCTSPSW